jgi:hypothetical protein
MAEVDRSDLPYQHASRTKPRRLMHRRTSTPGQAQELRGSIALSQNEFTLFWDSGPWAGSSRTFSYERLESFRIAGVAWLSLKLTLRFTDGTSIDCRIGKRMAANAKYILGAKGLPNK